MRHTLIALVRERVGAVDRIVGLLRRRGYATESLAIGASEMPGVSRMTIVLDVRDIEQVVHQLRRLVDIADVRSAPAARTVVRETALVKVMTRGEPRSALMRLAVRAGARVLDVGDAAMMLELTADPDEISAFVARVRDCGSVELTRSGQIAMTLDAAATDAGASTDPGHATRGADDVAA